MSTTTAAERVAQIRDGAARRLKSYRDSVAFHEKGLRAPRRPGDEAVRSHQADSLEQARRDLASAEAEVETLDGLSDLEVLNRELERQAQDRINLSDRLTKIYSTRDRDLHGKAQAYREQGARPLRDDMDSYVRSAMGRWASSYLYSVLQGIAALPRQPEADEVAELKATASLTNAQLRAAGDNPAKAWEYTDHEGIVTRLRHHARILGQRENLTAADVLRQVQADLGGETVEFGIPGVGTEPAAPPPPFLGEHWHNRHDYHVYEPPGGGRVLACKGGDAWHLDLYGADGRLLAYGEAAEADVTTLAPALAARASQWAGEDGYAWKRFEQVAGQLRAGVAAA